MAWSNVPAGSSRTRAAWSTTRPSESTADIEGISCSGPSNCYAAAIDSLFAIWNTAGLSPGPWQIGVWARQSGSTASYQAFAFITFQLTFG